MMKPQPVRGAALFMFRSDRFNWFDRYVVKFLQNLGQERWGRAATVGVVEEVGWGSFGVWFGVWA